MFKVFLLIVFFLTVFSHSGRTDSSGGHNCSTKSQNKGLCSGYHYHSGGVVKEKKSVSKLNRYNRKHFGGWIDEDGDCQNTRSEVLISHSQKTVKFKTTKKCKVVSGVWVDEYTGITYTNSSDLEIDHIVSLAEAWRSGANEWTKEKRLEFANNTNNLVPVSKTINKKKSDKDTSKWLPPKNKCNYIKIWIKIKKEYGLVYDEIEQKSINKLLVNCVFNK